MGAGAMGTVIDDFNGDNFDHGPYGFLGGGYIAAWTTGARPIEHHPVPKGTPRWGLEWKKAVARHYLSSGSLSTHDSSYPSPTNYISLDQTYTDSFRQPLMRMTFDFTKNDTAMSRFLTDRALEIARNMGAEKVEPQYLSSRYSIVPIRPRTIPAGRSWAATRKPALSTGICNFGTCPIFSSWLSPSTIQPRRGIWFHPGFSARGWRSLLSAGACRYCSIIS
jgi:gluconate 2-dehydrogenase alpha chain